MCSKHSFIPRDDTGLHQRFMFGQWIYTWWRRGKGCPWVAWEGPLGEGHRGPNWAQVPWTFFSDLKPQLKSSRRAPGHAPSWEPPQQECPLRAMGKKPVTKINVALPKPEESLAVQFKNNLKTILEKWLRPVHKGVGSLRYRLHWGQTNTSNLNKKKVRPKAILYKGDFFLPSAMLPQILARTICKRPNLPSPQHCQRRAKSIRLVGQ